MLYIKTLKCRHCNKQFAGEWRHLAITNHMRNVHSVHSPEDFTDFCRLLISFFLESEESTYENHPSKITEIFVENAICEEVVFVTDRRSAENFDQSYGQSTLEDTYKEMGEIIEQNRTSTKEA